MLTNARNAPNDEALKLDFLAIVELHVWMCVQGPVRRTYIQAWEQHATRHKFQAFLLYASVAFAVIWPFNEHGQ